jgi:hypothetical protein
MHAISPKKTKRKKLRCVSKIFKSLTSSGYIYIYIYTRNLGDTKRTNDLMIVTNHSQTI